MAKKTREDRVAEKINQGMDPLEAEMAIVQEDAQKRIDRLRALKEKQDARIRERIVQILEEQDPSTYGRLRAAAVEDLDAESRRRSERARGVPQYDPED